MRRSTNALLYKMLLHLLHMHHTLGRPSVEHVSSAQLLLVATELFRCVCACVAVLHDSEHKQACLLEVVLAATWALDHLVHQRKAGGSFWLPVPLIHNGAKQVVILWLPVPLTHNGAKQVVV